MGLFDRFLQIFRGKESSPQPGPRSEKKSSETASAGKEILSPAEGKPAATTASLTKTITPRPGRSFDLDAGDFLPIEREEMVAEAKKVRWNWLFGRRDLIPPADDPRTKLIDRGLVSNGLLTPEQLVEIHQVGDEMDRVRPTLERIHQEAAQAGEAAIQAERERRAEIKKQKKAESAERKRQRAEAIAQRRATDIVFLGRGVSGRLGNRDSNPAKLAALGLPILSTPKELADALGLSIPRLRWLAYHTEVAERIHYVTFSIPKKSGGTRLLSAPHKTLAQAQEWILQNILGKLPTEPAAHGFLPGKSILSNAQPHVCKAVLVNLDLENFFPSITFPRVRSVFHRLGYSPAVATILALLCTECPRRPVQYAGKNYHVAVGPRGLPQGACTSPALSNQVARRLDRRLQGMAAKLGLTYTRYADDLTFSGDGAMKGRTGYLMARVRHIVQDEGFRVHEKKSRVLRQNTAQLVTGVVVNDRLGIRRKELRRLRAILHRAHIEGLEAQNRDQRPNFRAWLEGKIAFVSMVRPEIGRKLKEELSSLRK